MIKMIDLISRTPWWAYLLAAAAVVWMGQQTQGEIDRQEAIVTAALSQQQPRAVALDVFLAARDAGMIGEATILAQIDTSRTTVLNTAPEQTMYVLADPKAETGPVQVKAVVVIPAAQAEAFLATAYDNVRGSGVMGPVFALNGRATTAHPTETAVADALVSMNLRASPHMQFLTPFVGGRAAGMFALLPDRAAAFQKTALAASLLLFLAFVQAAVWYARRRAEIAARVLDAQALADAELETRETLIVQQAEARSVPRKPNASKWAMTKNTTPMHHALKVRASAGDAPKSAKPQDALPKAAVQPKRSAKERLREDPFERLARELGNTVSAEA